MRPDSRARVLAHAQRWNVLAVALGLCVLLLTALAPLLAAARIVAPLLPPRARCGTRLVLLIAAYLVTFECGTLAGTLARLGRSRTQDRAEAVFARHSRRFFTAGFRLAGLRLHAEGVAPPVAADRPVVVIARHAGFLNAVLIFYWTLSTLRRSPVAIAKRAVFADPGLAAVARDFRLLPFPWTAHGRVCALRRLIAEARQAGPGDALIIFPEGTNLTARRRRQALATLRSRGDDTQATRFAPLRHVLPPQPSGTIKLLQHAAGADVVVFAHTGLEDLAAVVTDVGYPARADGTVRLTWWHYPAADIPRDTAGIQDWLTARWHDLDGWITQARGPGEPAPNEVAGESTLEAIGHSG
jgi:1-acyl-sn-glycerol-3-phosphate acyltransferase